MARHDLAPLLGRQPPPGLPISFRQGTVVEWEPTTAANVILVDGALLTNLPTYASSTEVRLIRPGDAVAIHSVSAGGSATMYIVGRITQPGTPQAASLMEAFGWQAAQITDFEATSSTSYTNLATVGPVVEDVLVGPAGRCLVLWGCHIQENSLTTPRGGSMSIEVSGATALAATFTRRYIAGHSDDGIDVDSSTNNLRMRAMTGELLTGLNPGMHTFTAKYRAETVAVNIDFGERIVIAAPM